MSLDNAFVLIEGHPKKLGLGELIAAEGFHYVDAGGAGGGKHGGDDGGGEKDDCGGEHGRGAGHVHVGDIAAGKAREHVACGGAGDNTCACHDGAFGDDAAEQMLRLSAEGEPDAELAGASADGERENARDADDGDGERNRSESAEDERVQTIGCEDFGARVFESGGVFDGLVNRKVADDSRDRSDERVRIRVHVDEQTAGPDIHLLERMVDGHDRAGNHVFIVNVADHADDAARRSADVNKFHHGIGPHQVMADGILIREHELREGLADDDDLVAILVIGFIEIASGEDGDAERGEKTGRDCAQICAGIIFTGAANLTVGRELEAGAKAACVTPGDDGAQGDVIHAGKRLDLANGFLVEANDLVWRAAVGRLRAR